MSTASGAFRWCRGRRGDACANGPAVGSVPGRSGAGRRRGQERVAWLISRDCPRPVLRHTVIVRLPPAAIDAPPGRLLNRCREVSAVARCRVTRWRHASDEQVRGEDLPVTATGPSWPTFTSLNVLLGPGTFERADPGQRRRAVHGHARGEPTVHGPLRLDHQRAAAAPLLGTVSGRSPPTSNESIGPGRSRRSARGQPRR